MEFENEFEVPVPVDQAWDILMDIERIAPCVPGAELTEVVDKDTYKGKISVKLGPVALTFNGQTTFEEINVGDHGATLKAQGTDAKGRGGAHAIVTFQMTPSEKGTRVEIQTNLQLSGAVAQYGRGVGMVKDLSQQIISQFASNLEKNVIGPQDNAFGETTDKQEAISPRSGETVSPEPIQMGGMGLRVLWRAIKRFLGFKAT